WARAWPWLTLTSVQGFTTSTPGSPARAVASPRTLLGVERYSGRPLTPVQGFPTPTPGLSTVESSINVETPESVETKHAPCLFKFHRTKSFRFAPSFHVN